MTQRKMSEANLSKTNNEPEPCLETVTKEQDNFPVPDDVIEIQDEVDVAPPVQSPLQSTFSRSPMMSTLNRSSSPDMFDMSDNDDADDNHENKTNNDTTNCGGIKRKTESESSSNENSSKRLCMDQIEMDEVGYEEQNDFNREK